MSDRRVSDRRVFEEWSRKIRYSKGRSNTLTETTCWICCAPTDDDRCCHKHHREWSDLKDAPTGAHFIEWVESHPDYVSPLGLCANCQSWNTSPGDYLCESCRGVDKSAHP
jgi:hypothetical protein